jgi:hypothetical protein
MSGTATTVEPRQPVTLDDMQAESGGQRERREMFAPRCGTTPTMSPGTRTSNQGARTPAAVRSCHARSSRTEVESYGLASRLPLAQRLVLVGKVAGLEGRLFDGEGHLRAGLSREMADTLLSQVNDLRHDLGWLSLDLHHHQVWPAHLAS